MSYLAYHFKVVPPQPGSEILMALLADYGFESFEYEDAGLVGYVRKEAVAGFSPADIESDAFTFTFTVEELPLKNWNEEWEKNFTPVRVDDRLCIRAPFHPHSDAKMEIIITPKMSFGTGHHQTTRLVCRAMFGLPVANSRVLDMGTGTGVLAILAAKLGAETVVAIDNDNWSVENARENCAMNGATTVKVVAGDARALEDVRDMSVILANINRNVLCAQLPAYARAAAHGCHLLLSGFFVTDADEIRKAASGAGFSFQSMTSEDEWACLYFRRS